MADPPTPYSISTITATGFLGTEIDLEKLFDVLQVEATSDDFSKLENQVTYAEFGKKKNVPIFKGFSKKFLIQRRKIKPLNRFDNQLSLVFPLVNENGRCNLNIKLFRNGNIQVTGIKYIDGGPQVLSIVKKIISDVCKEHPQVCDVSLLEPTMYKIQLINTDFKVGFEIKRDNLAKLLNGINIYSYEPCIYPGVKIEYYYNKANHRKDGNCYCENCNCHEKKNNAKICKKITISVFQSGRIIITGSQTAAQIEECYEYINTLLYSNLDRVEKKQIFRISEEQ